MRSSCGKRHENRVALTTRDSKVDTHYSQERMKADRIDSDTSMRHILPNGLSALSNICLTGPLFEAIGSPELPF